LLTIRFSDEGDPSNFSCFLKNVFVHIYHIIDIICKNKVYISIVIEWLLKFPSHLHENILFSPIIGE